MPQIREEKSWFLVQLKPNCIKIAERHLHRQGFQTFTPIEDVTVRSGSKYVRQTRPVFPGYTFVSFDLRSSYWQAINSTIGVLRLVSFGETPAQVPKGVIRDLMGRCDGTGRLMPPREFKAGDRVQVSSGVFSDFYGEVISVAPDQRVWILMEIMGGAKRIEVSSNALRSGC